MIEGQQLSLLFIDLSILCQVNLVPNQDLGDIISCVLSDGFYPGVHILEGPLVCYVIGDDDAVSLLVKRIRQGLESLLSSCVPYFDCEISAVFRFVLFDHEVKA